jgi:rhodanese-related sulfurtransferase
MRTNSNLSASSLDRPLQVEELRPRDFLERWPDQAMTRVVLLDVREPMEVALANISGATCIPMREVPGRLDEIARDQPIVVMCHSGIRSRQVAAFLSASGFPEVFNLAGGIDAWSQELDPGIPRY